MNVEPFLKDTGDGRKVIGPDTYRYLAAGDGQPVSSPFHLRWLLPKLLGDNHRAWWLTWCASWLVAAASFYSWRSFAGDDWRIALAGTGLLIGLPGILGPMVSIPVQTDLPATAAMLAGIAVAEIGHPASIAAGIVIIGIGASIRETVPIWAALTVWSPWPLIGLVPVAVVVLVRKPGPDPLPEFQHITDHPVRSSLESRRGRWRDGWLMVAPWGVTLAALVGIDWRLCVLLAVAYAQLLVATDTVRLLHHAVGPAMAAAAANVIPVEWLLFAVVVHVVWFRTPERV